MFLLWTVINNDSSVRDCTILWDMISWVFIIMRELVLAVLVRSSPWANAPNYLPNEHSHVSLRIGSKIFGERS